MGGRPAPALQGFNGSRLGRPIAGVFCPGWCTCPCMFSVYLSVHVRATFTRQRHMDTIQRACSHV